MTDPPPDADTLPPPEATEAPPAPPRRLGRAGIWVLVALFVALLVAGSVPYWAPTLGLTLPWGHREDAEQQRLTGLEQAHRSIDARLARTEQQVEGVNGAALQALDSRLTKLEQQPAAPPDAAALAPLEQRLDRLAERLDAIETRLDKLASAGASFAGADRILLVAVAELRGAIAQSRPFADALATVEALARDRPELAALLKPLEPVAATGIPSAALLAGRFAHATAPAILRADAEAPAAAADSTWRAEILARLERLVVVRRIAPSRGAPGGDAAAAVSRVQAALDDGDLAGAVATLERLGGAAAEAARPWLVVARRRLAVEAAIAALTQRVALDLAPSGKAPANDAVR